MTAQQDDDALLRKASRIAVHGLGREGRSVLADLSTTNPTADVIVLDDRDLSEADRALVASHNATPVLGSAAAATVTRDVDVVVRSPGVAHSHPGQQAARDAGVPVTTTLNIFLSRHQPDNVVGVTGTKGKSTTAMLVGHMLAAGDQRVDVVGNVGVPVLDMTVDPSALDTLVVELSSYQLSDLRGRLAIGLWLNLHADHHDWHGGAVAYARDKGRIAACSDTLVVNAADARVMAATQHHPARHTFDGRSDPVTLGSQRVTRDALADAMEQSHLVGRHNLGNVAAAVTLAHLRGVSVAESLAAVPSFAPLAHRLQVVHEADGLRWIDDSISTIPEAAVAAVAAFPDSPITLLAGGFDRGQDHAPLVAAVAARADGPAPVTVITMPPTGDRLAVALADARLRALPTTSLEEAVNRARRSAPRPGIVLLSPAAPSFHAFTSYADRGNAFAELAAQH